MRPKFELERTYNLRISISPQPRRRQTATRLPRYDGGVLAICLSYKLSIRTHKESTWFTELFYSPAHPQPRNNTKRARRTTSIHSPLHHRGHELAVN